ncbi:MAG: hypothetical protein EAZ24_06855, partial [Burkholderiales bacterium]
MSYQLIKKIAAAADSIGRFVPRLKMRFEASGLVTAVFASIIASLVSLPLAQHANAFGDVRMPNMEYVESNVDLSVKVLGGDITVRRTWHRGAWYVNPSWGDLKFQLDPLDNSVKAIDRMG